MTWRDVPEPPKIRRLEHDARGFPIPYIAQRFDSLRPAPVIGALGMVMTDNPNVPDLRMGKMSEVRQRECWLKGLCQVCGDPIEGARFVAGGLWDQPVMSFAFREPWCDIECMRYALQVCPGLVAGNRLGGLRVVNVAQLALYQERLWVHNSGEFKVPLKHTLTELERLDSILVFLIGRVNGLVMTPEDFLAAVPA